MRTPIPTEQARDRALAIAHDTERLRNLIDTLPPARIDVLNDWRRTLTAIQTEYVQLVRACDRELGE